MGTGHQSKYFMNTALKVSVLGVILVRIFPVFSRIRTEYGEIQISRIRTEYGEVLRISLYSVRMRENSGKLPTRINPNTDTFYAVEFSWNIIIS